MKSRSKTPPPSRKPATDSHASSPERDHYLREKERRARKLGPDHDLLAAARREYEAMLVADAAKGKGGRPKKTASVKKPAGAEFDLEEQDGQSEMAGEHEAEARQEADEAEDE